MTRQSVAGLLSGYLLIHYYHLSALLILCSLVVYTVAYGTGTRVGYYRSVVANDLICDSGDCNELLTAKIIFSVFMVLPILHFDDLKFDAGVL